MLTVAVMAAGITVPGGTDASARTRTRGPAAPTILYTEDFENRPNQGVEVGLAAYTGASGATYTADPFWLSGPACNGFVLNAVNPPLPGGCGASVHPYLQTLAKQLGALNGTNPDTGNSALAAMTSGNPPANNLVQFRTVNQIPLPGQGHRFVAFSVNAAAISCPPQANPPLMQFQLVDGATVVPVGGQINVCAKGGNGAHTFTTDGAVLFDGTALGVVMRNQQPSGVGNDGAIDDIKILDVTPQLDEEFTPAWVADGERSTVRFTITNTSELGQKPGWRLTGTLPPGVTIGGAGSTTCTAATLTAPEGGSSIGVTGTLPKGKESCTAEFPVVAPSGDYVNEVSDVKVTGLNPPTAPARVTFGNTPVLTISHSGAPAEYLPGRPLTYTVTAANTGAATATGARVTVPLPPELRDAGYTWTCAPTGGASCAASGDGAIDDTVTLPADGQVVYTLTGNVPVTTSVGELTGTATLRPPPGVPSPGCSPSCSATVTTPRGTVNASIGGIASVSPPTATRAGDQVTFSTELTNTGNVTLSQVSPSQITFTGSGTAPVPACPVTVLEPGASTTCTGTYALTQADVDAGQVTATTIGRGKDPSGRDIASPETTAVLSTETPGTGGVPVLRWPVDGGLIQDEQELFLGDGARPGQTVRVVDAQRGTLCSVLAAESGRWSCHAAIEPGDYAVTAQNRAGADGPARFTVTDALLPQTRPGEAAVPFLTQPAEGDRLADPTPTLVGVGAHPSEAVTITAGPRSCRAIAKDDGSFQCSLDRPLAPGPYQATAVTGGVRSPVVKFVADPSAVPAPRPERHESTGTIDAWTLRTASAPVDPAVPAALCGDAADPNAAVVTLPLFPGTSVTVTTTTARRKGDRILWTGSVSSTSRGQAVLSASCVGPPDLMGVISTNGRIYELGERDGRAVVTEYDGAAFELGEPDLTVFGTRKTAGPSSARQAAGRPVVVDVLSMYTPLAAAAAGGDAKMEARIDLAVAMANAAMSVSDVPIRVRLVHKAKAVGYRGSEDAGKALGPFNDGSDGIIDEAPRLRDKYGADVAALWTSAGSGVAYGPPDPGPDMAYYGYMSLNQSYIPINTFAHELGHVLGGTHDWVADPQPHNPTKKYDHAYLGPKNQWVSILGYGSSCNGCPRIPYYANADDSYNGAALGRDDGAKPSDTSARFNQTAAAVAAYRAPRTPAVLRELTTGAAPAGAGGAVPATKGPYLDGTTVRATPVSKPGYAFKGWTLDGRDVPASASLDVLMDRDHTLVARYSAGSRPRYLLSSEVVPAGAGRMTVSPSTDSLGRGARVVGQAAPAGGYRFAGWEVNGEPAGSSPMIDIKIADDTTLLARFGKPVHDLSVTDDGAGTTRVNRTGPYADGEIVEITAAPGPGQTITGWLVDGIRRPGSTVLALNMTRDSQVVAQFGPLPPADVVLTAAAPAQATAGTVLVVPFDLRNNGSGPAQDLVLTAGIPSWLKVSVPPAGCRLAGTALTCALRDLDPGATTQVVLRGVVDPAVVGASRLSASIGWSRPGSRLARGTSVTTSVSVVGRADIVLAGTVGKLARGKTGTVVYKAVNRGPSAARSVVFAGSFNRAQVSVTRVSGTGCRKIGNGFLCSRPTTTAGSTSPVTITVAVSRRAKGAFAAKASIRSSTPDTSAANNTATVPAKGSPPRLGEEPVDLWRLRPVFHGVDTPGTTIIIAGACTTTARLDGTWECGFARSQPIPVSVAVPPVRKPAKSKPKRPPNACRAVTFAHCRAASR